MGIKLGDISPVAGLLTGEGLTTNFGLVPALLAKQREDEEERKKKESQAAQAEQANRAATGMKKGGKVNSASKRGDGIAKRGKTKGRMV